MCDHVPAWRWRFHVWSPTCGSGRPDPFLLNDIPHIEGQIPCLQGPILGLKKQLPVSGRPFPGLKVQGQSLGSLASWLKARAPEPTEAILPWSALAGKEGLHAISNSRNGPVIAKFRLCCDISDPRISRKIRRLARSSCAVAQENNASTEQKYLKGTVGDTNQVFWLRI